MKFYRKKQKQSESLVEILVFHEKGHALLGGKQKSLGPLPMRVSPSVQERAGLWDVLSEFPWTQEQNSWVSNTQR